MRLVRRIIGGFQASSGRRASEDLDAELDFLETTVEHKMRTGLTRRKPSRRASGAGSVER
jgi:hypothetical protein